MSIIHRLLVAILLLASAGPVFGQSFVTRGLQFWFEGDCIGTSCSVPSNGTNITTWLDQSSNANNLTVSAGTCTFHTSQINGKPAVTFTGCKLTLGSTVAASSAETMFSLIKLSAGSVGGIIGGASGGINWYTTNQQELDSPSCGGGFNGAGSAALGTSNWHQLNVSAANSTVPIFRIDGAVDTWTNLGASTTLTSTTGPESAVGVYSTGCLTSDIFAGQMALVAYYNVALSGPEIAQNEAYICGKYGIGCAGGPKATMILE